MACTIIAVKVVAAFGVAMALLGNNLGWLMFTRMAIKNFRVFRELDVVNLERINLFAG